MIGTTVEQYRIEQRLGGGGMGEVFRARDLELDRDVAIKLLRPELSDLEDITARFRAEARTLAGLAHTNIATVFRFFPSDGTLYLVMEYISGQPFGDLLRDHGARPPSEVVHLLKQVLAGLGYAHENKVVHRDIKPGNLMLDGHSTVKVLDFGIAHLLDQTRITQSGSVLGTPAYMAPEQVLGQQVDGRTDLYALGIVLFELLTGKLPFRANSQFELMRAHLETEPRSLNEMNDTVPRPMQETVVRALAKDSSERYQSAAQFAQALGDALQESIEDGHDVQTVADAGRSPVKVAMGTPVAGTVARDKKANPISGGGAGDEGGIDEATAVRMPNSVEIPLPPPRTAAGLGVAAAFLAGVGIWWINSSDDSAQPPQVVTELAAPTRSTAAPNTQEQPTAYSAGTQDDGTTTQIASDVTPPGESPSNAPAVAADLMPNTAPAQQQVTTAPRAAAPQAVAPVTRAAPPAPTAVPASRYVVQATKVSVHERQRTGRLSRAAGYNGSFTLSAPRDAQPLQIDEYIEVYSNGRQLTRQVINSQIRKPGRFKSKQRIPGLKELRPGNYQLRLVFVSEGRRLGIHEWTLVVTG